MNVQARDTAICEPHAVLANLSLMTFRMCFRKFTFTYVAKTSTSKTMQNIESS